MRRRAHATETVLARSQFLSARSDTYSIVSGSSRRAVRLTESSSSILGRLDFRSLGPDPFGEMQIFAGAQETGELDQRLDEQIRTEVAAMLAATEEFDAFDVIELLRLRELPIVPVLGLRPDYDGNSAVIDLVSLVLLTRGTRAPGSTPRAETQPHHVIAELHQRAARLLRLSTYKAVAAAAMRTSDPLARLAAEYQSYRVSVRGMQYDSVQAKHDAALFDRPEIEALLTERLGFSYADFRSVRESIQSAYSDALTHLRDVTADIIQTAQAEHREPTPDELGTFRESMLAMMFLPAERASFTALEIAQASGVAHSRVQAVLDAFSIDFDDGLDAATVVRQLLRGVNPLAKTCLLRDANGRHLMTGIQIGADSFRAVIEARFKSDPKVWRRYDRTRAEVSESLARDSLTAVFGTHPQHVNLKYLAPKAGETAEVLAKDCVDPRSVADQTESDCLFVIEDVAICVEVKGRTIADAARRGDHVRLKTEINNIFGTGAGQARRLETLVRTNGGVWLETGRWLDLSYVREIRSIVVGLDDFGPLAVALGDLQRSGLLGAGDSPPWITSLHDLDVISTVLERPAEFLLYLRRRTDSGVAQHYRGSDELDLFMLFMDGGLYVEPDPDEIRQRYPMASPASAQDRRRHRQDARPTVVGTYTDPLDAWMYWIEGTSPDEAAKPTFNAHESATTIVDFLADGRKPGWLRFGADLLGLEGQAQKRLGSALQTLAKRTRADHQRRSLVQGYAGLWGYPTFFAGTAPSGQPHRDAVEALRLYMSAKKHQLRSDRSLGLVLDEDGEIVHVIYANDLPIANPQLDALGSAIGLQPVGLATTSARAETSVSRRRRKGRGKSKRRR